jgi:hypothetical protein
MTGSEDGMTISRGNGRNRENYLKAISSTTNLSGEKPESTAETRNRDFLVKVFLVLI